MSETTVKVVVRCRPLLPHETDKDVKNVSTIDEDGGRITISGRTHDYGNESVVGGGDRHATYVSRVQPVRQPSVSTRAVSGCRR